MRRKLLIFLSIMFLFFQSFNLARGEWIVAEDNGGRDDDAIDIHSYEDEYKS